MAKGAKVVRLPAVARLPWLPLTDGDAWNPKARAVAHDAKGKPRAGVYVVRDRSSGRVLYVGESSSGRLWKTLLRHFQDPTGKFARHEFAGIRGSWTHAQPGKLEVAILPVADGQPSMDLQARAIKKYRPAHNRDDGTAKAKKGERAAPDLSGPWDDAGGAEDDYFGQFKTNPGDMDEDCTCGAPHRARGARANPDEDEDEDEATRELCPVCGSASPWRCFDPDTGRCSNVEDDAPAPPTAKRVRRGRANPGHGRMAFELVDLAGGPSFVKEKPGPGSFGGLAFLDADGRTLYDTEDRIAPDAAARAFVKWIALAYKEAARHRPIPAYSAPPSEIAGFALRVAAALPKWPKGVPIVRVGARTLSGQIAKPRTLVDGSGHNLGVTKLGDMIPTLLRLSMLGEVVAAMKAKASAREAQRRAADSSYTDTEREAYGAAAELLQLVGQDAPVTPPARAPRPKTPPPPPPPPPPGPKPEGFGAEDGKRPGQLRMFNPAKKGQKGRANPTPIALPWTRAASKPSGELVVLGCLTELEYVTRSGEVAAWRWTLKTAPALAYDGRGRLFVVYGGRRVGRASGAARREYARTHWGVPGRGEVLSGAILVGAASVLGRGTRITYTTRKGTDAALVDYVHAWGEGGRGAFEAPMVVRQGERLALAGGSYRVNDRGIVG